MKTLAEKLALEKANKARVAAVRKAFAKQCAATTDKNGNYVVVKKGA